MARRRFFVKEVRSGQAEIAGDQAWHLARVLRIEAGQTFEITDNSRVWLASVETARKDLVRFRVIEEIASGPEIPHVALYLSLIKFERFEWAVEKATELGVARIVPVEASRSEQGLLAGAMKRVERWRRIAHEASEQARRLRAPVIANPVRFREALEDTSTHRVWMDEQSGAKPLSEIFTLRPGDTCAVMIGPEGGWSDAEREDFIEKKWAGASLGPMILRAETAASAALAVVVQGWLGRADRIENSR